MICTAFELLSCLGFVLKQNNPAAGMTKRSYMESVKAGMDLAAPSSPIHVRLMPSIDRKETTEAAMETVSTSLAVLDSTFHRPKMIRVLSNSLETIVIKKISSTRDNGACFNSAGSSCL
jgi:hypothetical protein